MEVIILKEELKIEEQRLKLNKKYLYLNEKTKVLINLGFFISHKKSKPASHRYNRSTLAVFRPWGIKKGAGRTNLQAQMYKELFI